MICKPSSSPNPVKDDALVRFAFLYEDLKISGILCLLHISETFCATSNTSSSLSTTQGPAIRKKESWSYSCAAKRSSKNLVMGAKVEKCKMSIVQSTVSSRKQSFQTTEYVTGYCA